ncbi:hypothetical protein [Thermomonas sp.]|uniref:hypothetical protein n=1 Tax=Thermomonas sp. TaxID=1971895 RepID=UPI001DED2DC8|nr:hypothetical protein [Thermomonas sp.]MBZ0087098.1 hypothetical protein [Thermomonas sp.]MCO5055245.1 hypothetical protein [Thermomonas sp.]HRO62232.1 hypothetical protein [Thermomonas sp.]
MNAQAKPRNRARNVLTQRQVRTQVSALIASFIPDLDSDRGFGLGYGRSSSYGVTSSYVPNVRPLFRFR